MAVYWVFTMLAFVALFISQAVADTTVIFGGNVTVDTSTSTTLMCENGGTLYEDADGKFGCNCSQNYTGKYCQTVNCNNCGDLVHAKVFKNYNAHIRPQYTLGDVTMANVSFTMINLVGINEKEEQMEVMGFFVARWKDHRLMWDLDDFGGVSSIVVPAQQVWLPDIIISNSAISFYEYAYKRDFLVTIYYYGTLVWEYGGIILTSCDINMALYPFDNQTCSIEIETWNYGMSKLNLSMRSVRARPSVYGNALWNLTEYDGERSLIYGGSYSRITFTFHWQRKRMYYYMNILIPALMLLLVALGVYWLPSETGEKVSLAVTVLLAFSVFLIIIMDNTPQNSAQVPTITVFVLLVMGITTLSLLVSIFIAYMYGNANAKRAPKWLRAICFGCLARIMCLRSIVPNIEEDENDLTLEERVISNDNNRIADKAQPHNGKVEETSLSTYSELRILHKQLGQILSYLEDKKLSDNINDEWQAIGRILDRLFFWLSLILVVVLVPLLLLEVL